MKHLPQKDQTLRAISRMQSHEATNHAPVDWDTAEDDAATAPADLATPWRLSMELSSTSTAAMALSPAAASSSSSVVSTYHDINGVRSIPTSEKKNICATQPHACPYRDLGALARSGPGRRRGRGLGRRRARVVRGGLRRGRRRRCVLGRGLALGRGAPPCLDHGAGGGAGYGSATRGGRPTAPRRMGGGTVISRRGGEGSEMPGWVERRRGVGFFPSV